MSYMNDRVAVFVRRHFNAFSSSELLEPLISEMGEYWRLKRSQRRGLALIRRLYIEAAGNAHCPTSVSSVSYAQCPLSASEADERTEMIAEWKGQVQKVNEFALSTLNSAQKKVVRIGPLFFCHFHTLFSILLLEYYSILFLHTAVSAIIYCSSYVISIDMSPPCHISH